MELRENDIVIEERIKKIISQILNISPKDILSSLSFAKELGIDEYDLSAIIMAIEEEFGIKILEKEVEEIVNVNDLSQRVHRQIAKKEVRS